MINCMQNLFMQDVEESDKTQESYNKRRKKQFNK
jgi:hypothetical protein